MVRTTTCSCIEPARSCNSALECLFTKANRFSGVGLILPRTREGVSVRFYSHRGSNKRFNSRSIELFSREIVLYFKKVHE